MSLEIKSIAETSIQEGRLFTVGHTSPSIAAAGVYLFAWTTGSRPVEFMDRTYTGSFNEGLVELFENSYTGGTPYTAQNRNQIFGGTGPVSYETTPTATITGPLVGNTKLISGSGAASTRVGYFTESERFILKPSTQYVLRVTNQDTNPGVVTFRFTYRATELVS